MTWQLCVLGKWSQIPRINSDNDDAVTSCLTCPATAAMHCLSPRLALAWVNFSPLGCGCLIGHYKLYSSVRGFSSSLLRKFRVAFIFFFFGFFKPWTDSRLSSLEATELYANASENCRFKKQQVMKLLPMPIEHPFSIDKRCLVIILNLTQMSSTQSGHSKYRGRRRSSALPNR